MTCFQGYLMDFIKKTQDKDPKYHSLGHNVATTNLNLGNADGEHAGHIHIHPGCRGYTGGKRV